MEFRNFTPFPALAYQALDQHGAHHHVVAMRQTLTIQEDGTLTYADTQDPLVVEDEYFGEMNRSSVRQESDLAPFKPKCDVIVVATAYAPKGEPAPRFEVCARMTGVSGANAGKVILEKRLVIAGRRFWRKHPLFGSWRLSQPEPLTSLPVRYEYAYGGELKVEDEAGRRDAMAHGKDPEFVPPMGHTVVESNPVGRGFSQEWHRKATRGNEVAAPQIEIPNQPVMMFGQDYAVQGFGVITKAWLPRRALAGTADDAFAKSDRWLPEDFDFSFWNGAHPDLQAPYLVGDEIIELTNLTRTGTLRLQLPGHRPFVLVRYEGGDIEPATLNLDTLFIDVESGTLAMVHRLVMPIEPELRVLEARLVTKEEWDAATAEQTPNSEFETRAAPAIA